MTMTGIGNRRRNFPLNPRLVPREFTHKFSEDSYAVGSNNNNNNNTPNNNLIHGYNGETKPKFRGRSQGICKVLVSRIPKHVPKKDIHSLLSTFGNVTSCENKAIDLDKDKPDWYRVLVTFEAPEQAQQAVRNLSGYKYEGSVLRIDYNRDHNEDRNKRQNGAGGPGRGMSRGLGPMPGMVGCGGPMGGYHGPPMMAAPPPPRDIPLRMLVPSEMVGAIIGKSGATIKQITQQSRARVDVHRKDAVGIYNQGQLEKVINIYGSAENCSTACRKILEVMILEAQETQDSNAKKEEPVALKLLAHNNLVGRVIGRAGAAIKKVMEDTNAKINVSSMSGDPRERIVIIKGDLEEMSRAQQMITAKMRQCYEHDLLQAAMLGGGGPMSMPPPPPPPAPHPHSHQHPYYPPFPHAAPHGPPRHGPHGPHGHAGHHGPHGGHGAHGGPGPHGGHHSHPPIPPPPPPHSHGGVGHTHSGHVPHGHGPHPHSHYAAYGAGGAGPSGPHGHMPHLPPSANGHFYPPGDGSVEVVHVWVPACTVGAIIGTGGSSIREMIRVSGCSIKVSPTSARDENKPKEESKENGEAEKTNETRDEKALSTTGAEAAAKPSGVGIHPQPTDRRVTLTGSAEAQWRAQCLLYRKVFLEAQQHIDANADAAKDPQLLNGHLRVEMNVPSNQVGRIIGKGGQTVKELQRLTRASIKLPEEASKNQAASSSTASDDDQETPVHIIGDFYATQAAQRQIRALVAKNTGGYQSTSSSLVNKKKEETPKTQKVEGDCNKSESQC